MASEGWRDVVLMTIKESPSKKEEGKGYGLYVVMRVKPDNTVFNVTVRSGGYYTINGEKRLPKDGLNEFDFFALREATIGEPVKACSCGKMRSATVFDDVKKLLDRRNPPPVPTEDAPPPPAPADEPIPDCPFD